jgi:hypothetical protein
LADRHTIASASLRQYLNRFRAQLRIWMAIDGIGRLLLAASLLLTASLLLDYVLDRFGPVSVGPRRLISVGLAATILFLVTQLLIRRLVRLPHDHALASWIEAKHPTLAGRLITSLEGENSPSPISRELVSQAGREAAEILVRIPSSSLLLPARPIARLGVGILGSLIIASLAMLFPRITQTWWSRVIEGSNREYPRWTQLTWIDRTDTDSESNSPTLKPLAMKVGRGRDAELMIKIVPGSHDPGSVRLDIRRDGIVERAPLLMTSTEPGRYRYLLRQVNETVAIRARGGDARTDWRSIEAVDPPVIADGQVDIDPPAYTRLGRRTVPLVGTNLAVPMFSTVTLRLRSSKPIASASARRLREPIEVELVVPDNLLLRTTIDKACSLQIDLTDTDGIDLAEPFLVDLEGTADRVPSLAVRPVGISSVITPRAIVPLRMEADDDYGLGNVTIHAAVGSRTILERAPIDGEPPWGKRIEQVQILDTADWSLKPGDNLAIRVDANDENDVNGPGRASSEEIRLEVVTPEEWLSRFAAREIQLRQRFEQVISELADARQSLERGSLEESDPSTAATMARLALDRGRSVLRKDRSESQSIALTFADMATELENNRLDNPALLGRLRRNIVEPMQAWVDEPFAQAIASLEGVADPPSREGLAAVLPPFDELLSRGQAILSAMQKLETFQEAVSLLKTIINDQNTLRQATQDRQKERARDILKD